MSKELALSGYRRLAFGKVSDAVKLLFAENVTDEELCRGDLFNVAEIKKPKDGAMEIKFFDRLKALEKLEECGTDETRSTSDFYRAVIGGVREADEKGDCEEE